MQISNCCQFTLMRQLLSFFRQFPKPLANSNTCIFVNIAWKMNCDILKSKLIVCEWNAFCFIEIAFIGFTFDEIKQCIVFFWDTRYVLCVSDISLVCVIYVLCVCYLCIYVFHWDCTLHGTSRLVCAYPFE